MFELRGRDQDRGGRGEAGKYRVGDEANDDAEIERGHEAMEQPDHEREQHHRAHVPLVSGRNHLAHRFGHEQRDERKRADGHVPRRAQRGVNRQRQQGGVEAVDGRKLGEHSVRHALRDQHHTHGDPCHHVRVQQRERVLGQPAERRYAPMGEAIGEAIGGAESETALDVRTRPRAERTFAVLRIVQHAITAQAAHELAVHLIRGLTAAPSLCVVVCRAPEKPTTGACRRQKP